MALEWTNLVDGKDIASAEPINKIAKAVIEDEANIEAIQAEMSNKADSDDVQTKLTEINTKINTKADKTELEELQTEVNGKANTADIPKTLNDLPLEWKEIFKSVSGVFSLETLLADTDFNEYVSSLANGFYHLNYVAHEGVSDHYGTVFSLYITKDSKYCYLQYDNINYKNKIYQKIDNEAWFQISNSMTDEMWDEFLENLETLFNSKTDKSYVDTLVGSITGEGEKYEELAQTIEDLKKQSETTSNKVEDLENDKADKTELSNVVAKSADKLTTARKINLTGSVTSSATFDGSKDIDINVPSIKESYLSWGVGKNWAGEIDPLGCALSDEHSANRIAYLSPKCFLWEYSRDGGETWTEYPNNGTYNYYKTMTTISDAGGTFSVAGISNDPITTDCKVRVTISANDSDGNAQIYTEITKILFYVNTNGAQNCTVLGESWHNQNGKYVTWFNATIAGWPGWSSVAPYYRRLNPSLTANSDDSRTSKIRFTFSVGALHSNTSYNNRLAIGGIRIFGSNCWTAPSNLAAKGRIYSINNEQGALFPAYVTATHFKGQILNAKAKIIGGKDYISIDTTNWTITFPQDMGLILSDNSYYNLSDAQTVDVTQETTKTSALKIIFNSTSKTFSVVPYSTTSSTWGDHVICTLRVPNTSIMSTYPISCDLSVPYKIDGKLYGLDVVEKSEYDKLAETVEALKTRVEKLEAE